MYQPTDGKQEETGDKTHIQVTGIGGTNNTVSAKTVNIIGQQNIHQTPVLRLPIPQHVGLPLPNPLFTGRGELLKQLAAALPSPKDKAVKPIVLIAFHGTGGIGKTEIAKAFVYQQIETYAFVAWLAAND